MKYHEHSPAETHPDDVIVDLEAYRQQTGRQLTGDMTATETEAAESTAVVIDPYSDAADELRAKRDEKALEASRSRHPSSYFKPGHSV